MDGFEVIVVGGGHAGIEAALASAKLGARTALVTHAVDEIGRMPCNPAIGGLGKGHLVRELDVLGGAMGRAIDRTGIQFRLLNRRKGPAVRAPRAQADKHRYRELMTAWVAAQPGLETVVGDVRDLVLDGPPSARSVCGVRLADGREIAADRVVLCTGTFLGGLMHVGETRTVGGREGAASSPGLGASLAAAGFRLQRLKTGTPPRLRRGSLDLDRLDVQPGDEDVFPFSFIDNELPENKIVCHLTWTNARAHALIRTNLHRSPLYAGAIEGVGPRYCPSIEDKVVRFSARERHHLFLEPEGLDTDEVYVNGLSTSLPADVQEDVVHALPGLESAELVRYGYAVEYDAVPSWQAGPSLESKPVAGLFLAGQILGTSGYEEAAAQGLVAGANAARSLAGRPPLRLPRSESYLGVLIDDLATKEITEPYRMFTSRAERRLALRCDNAAARLLPTAEDLGLLTDAELDLLRERVAAAGRIRNALFGSRLSSGNGSGAISGAELVRRNAGPVAEDSRTPEIPDALESILTDAARAPAGAPALAPIQQREARDQAIADLRYEGYITRQDNMLQRQSYLDELELPVPLPAAALDSISSEAREKLARMKPATLGQAARIDGVRAADLAILSVLLRRERNEARDA